MNQLVPWALTQSTCSLLENPPQPAGHCHLAAAITESSKGILPFHQTSYFMTVEKMIKQVNSVTWFIAILHLLRGDFLDQKQCCMEYYDTK